jgi:IS5 family transposase
MKGFTGADVELGQVRSVRGTSGNISDVTPGNSLLRGQESVAFGYAGYQGIEKRDDANEKVALNVAVRPGKRRGLNKETAPDVLIAKAEKIKASIWTNEEYLFWVVKRHFGFVKVRYRQLKKNSAHHITSHHIVCVIKFVDGAWKTDGRAEMSASASLRKCPEKA